MTLEGTRRHPELEAAIEKEPDNLDAYLVYADWLQARGDPRGELIALQCAAHGLPREQSWSLQGPAYAWVDKHEDALLGGWVGLKNQVRWRWGFIEALRLSEQMRTREGHTFTPAKFLRRFLTLPVARFLRGLDVELAGRKELSFQQLLGELNRPLFPLLERLSLGHRAKFMTTRIHSMWSLGDLSLSHESLPRLHSLVLYGRLGRLDQLDLPALRELTIFSGMTPGSLAHCLAGARLPRLERLVIEGHAELMDSMLVGEELRDLLELPALGHLKHLGLKRLFDSTLACGGAMCRILARSELLRRLETLDLSQDVMTDAVAQVLLSHAEAFTHLRRLDFSGDQMSARMAARVAALCGKGAGSERGT